MAETRTKNVKNVSGQVQFVIGIGEVSVGGTVEVAADFNNANFEEVKTQKKNKE